MGFQTLSAAELLQGANKAAMELRRPAPSLLPTVLLRIRLKTRVTVSSARWSRPTGARFRAKIIAKNLLRRILYLGSPKRKRRRSRKFLPPLFSDRHRQKITASLKRGERLSRRPPAAFTSPKQLLHRRPINCFFISLFIEKLKQQSINTESQFDFIFFKEKRNILPLQLPFYCYRCSITAQSSSNSFSLSY